MINAQEAWAEIVSQFPEFASTVHVEPFGEGFDNTAYLVNDTHVFRFPRREFAVQFMANECRILHAISGYLPVPVPCPSHVGQPSPTFPFPFAGYPLIQGRTGSAFPWTDASLACLAPGLGEFLRSLHSVTVTDQYWKEGPFDEIRRADVPYRLDRILEYQDRHPELVRLAHEVAEDAEPPARRVWVHGDLHPRHLVVNEAGELTGVIDWGDVHLGDPALDLSIAFTLFSGSARHGLLAAYGPVSAATLARARFRAIHYAVLLSDYGDGVEDADMIAVAQRAARNVFL